MIVDKDFITKEQKQFIEDLFFKYTTPFYYSSNAVRYENDTYDNCAHLVHHIIRDGKINSNLYELIAKDLIIQFCNKNNIQFNKIYRCAINVTFCLNTIKKSGIHTDHDFDYKHMLIYLNDADGDTVLLENDKKTEKARITPKQYKGVVFDKCWHYQELPSKLDRKVIVFTFK